MEVSINLRLIQLRNQKCCLNNGEYFNCSFKNNEILLDFSKVIEQGCCINDKRWRKTYSFRLKNNEVDTIQSKIDYFDY